ncbi:aminopeptidase [Pendulispora brunnea]|uniref:Aminopeptidase N n=1 Tax=Pendulispora brunnea TaxID=2905690 RepID=A0ABZ2KFS8_9BACT
MAPFLVFSWASLVASCSSSSDGLGLQSAPLKVSAADEAAPHDGGEYDVERYDLRGELDWEHQRLVATVGITVKARGLETLVLDSAVQVKAVRSATGIPLPFSVDAEHRKLRVDLSPLAGGATQLAIDYEAQGVYSDGSLENGFFMLPPLEGDPAASRVAFTFSEPSSKPSWMPCHDTPSDRAVFSIELKLPSNEKLLANGRLIFDEAEENTGTHRVKYDSGFTLPTYLMAFNVGDFAVEERRAHSGLPISLWHRRGIPNDDRTALRESIRALETFERLLGPYPFEHYAQVFAPGAMGEENTTISLLGEAYLDYSLYPSINIAGHELGHQWFGDLVTVETFYDLWIKEGMATLLEMENMRGYLDEGNVGTLGVERRDPRDGEPVVRDRSMPILPYGTGPYARANWVLSQIRYLTGERVFWSTLRKILREHRFGTIGTEAFVHEFAPHLGSEATAQVQRALVAKRIPRLQVEPAPAGAFVTLRDPDGALVTPMVARWIAPDGTKRDQELTVDARVELAPRTPGEFLVVDPLDVHPNAKKFATQDSVASGKNYESSVVPLLVPKGAGALAQWLRVGGLHHTALLSRKLPALSPEQFGPFVAKLGAEGAKMLAIQRACEVASDSSLDPNLRAAWSKALSRALRSPPSTIGLQEVRTTGFPACSNVVDVESVFASDWAKLEANPPDRGLSEARVAYLSQFDLPPARAWSVWTNVAKRSTSLNQRERAVKALSKYAYTSRVPAEAIPSWRAFFVERLTQSQSFAVLEASIEGAFAIKADTLAGNADFLSGLNAVLHDPVDYWNGITHTEALCAAYTVIGDAASPAWQSFVEGLSDANLKPDIRAFIDDPSRCADWF